MSRMEHDHELHLKRAFAALLILVSQLAVADDRPVTTVPNVDLERYLGRWYEVGSFPMFFQRHCIGETTADYALQEGGAFRSQPLPKRDGFIEAEGRATPVADSGNARLKVSFSGRSRPTTGSSGSTMPTAGRWWAIPTANISGYSPVRRCSTLLHLSKPARSPRHGVRPCPVAYDKAACRVRLLVGRHDEKGRCPFRCLQHRFSPSP